MKLANPFKNKDFAKFQIESGKATKIHILKNRQGKKFFVYQMKLFKDYYILYTYDYSPALNKLAKKTNSIYTLIESYEPIQISKSQSTYKSIRSIIPRHTNIINLSQSEEEMFNKMHPKGRYNIRLATKKGVQIREEFDAENFYKLLEQTADRDNFFVNSKDYYKIMIDTLGKKSIAKIYMAYYQDIPVAGIFIVNLKDTCIYYYGASANTNRDTKGPELLQWHAIKDAKLRGIKFYDFLGVADPANPKDPLNGVTYFKQKFGGDYTKWPDSITLVHKPILYALLKIKRFLNI